MLQTPKHDAIIIDENKENVQVQDEVMPTNSADTTLESDFSGFELDKDVNDGSSSNELQKIAQDLSKVPNPPDEQDKVYLIDFQKVRNIRSCFGPISGKRSGNHK